MLLLFGQSVLQPKHIQTIIINQGKYLVSRRLHEEKTHPPCTIHSQLLKIIILKSNSPVLLNLPGNIFPYCPAVRAIRKINSSNIHLQEGQCWSCN